MYTHKPANTQLETTEVVMALKQSNLMLMQNLLMMWGKGMVW